MITQFSDMVGQAFKQVYRQEDELHFIAEDGTDIGFWHDQDCCERVVLEDICGDLDDLAGAEIVEAEEVQEEYGGNDELAMWTFYKFRTEKGSVTVKWDGQSNGYYGVEVSMHVDGEWVL